MDQGCWLYILRCVDGSFYVGVTRKDVGTRVSEHNLALSGKAYTARRRPVTLAHAVHFERVLDAIAAERQLKGWRREKKEAYIRGEFELLSQLSSRRVRMQAV
ncbi:hypothetical protein GCM10007036_19250 [Alsobacter metallidurans]|uniref:GIY-YIG domain-containing protein n=1 Tax=Alsobacter metallidurans TaxID=340221 RepID=A0A917MHG6_9HYPH|nr:GIY-YIG nuclease family protein [Alsobacter metallidurans]GGH17652.1 hypothetical protein GCM10007036_19250 [Alsobacter metallidurans]